MLIIHIEKVGHLLFYAEDIHGNYTQVPLEDILMIDMKDGRIPTLHTANGIYYLPTKFRQVKKMLKQLDLKFKKTDRGILINLEKVVGLDKEKRLVILDEEKDIKATVSENKMKFFEDYF